MTRAGALARTADRHRRLTTVSVPLPADVDPLMLWRVVPEPQRFFWERPADGEAVVGVGATAVVHGTGEDRLATVARALSDLARPADAVVVGGFAFDSRHVAVGPWHDFPAAEWLVPRLAVWRRGRRTALVATTLGAGEEEPTALRRELETARTALARTRRRPPPPTVPAHYQVSSGDSAAAWRAAVEAALGDIATGRLEKVVLARTCTVDVRGGLDPLRVIDRLRRAYPGCTVFAVGRGSRTFVGATPERLARVENGDLLTAAIAGTAPRGTSPVADRALARTLRTSVKERAEHDIVLRDLRARLTPLCSSVTEAAAPRLLRTEALQHLCTRLGGRLRPGLGLLDVAGALHPTPAVCGAPRAEAMAALAAYEKTPRGWYAGGVGWLSADGNGEIAVPLRCALLSGGQALLYAGCGIVSGSDWEAELTETRLKFQPLLTALLEV